MVKTLDYTSNDMVHNQTHNRLGEQENNDNSNILDKVSVVSLIFRHIAL